MPQIINERHIIFASAPEAPDQKPTEHSVHDNDMCAIATATELVARGWHHVSVESRMSIRLARVTFRKEKNHPLSKVEGVDMVIADIEAL